MAQSNRRLAMQAWLLILLTSSLLISVSSLLLDRVAHLPLPPQWRLSPDGILAVLVVSVGLLTLLSHQSRWRYLAGGLMIALAGYSLGHDLLAPGTDDGLSWLTGQPRLGTVPVLLVVIMGTSCFFSPASGSTRRGYRLIGWTSIIIGVTTLAYPLITQTPPDSVAGLTSMGSLFCLLLGAALLIIAHQRTYPTLPLPRSAIIVGVLGVTVSILIWLASSWVQYNARLTAADTLVNNVADGMEQQIESRVKQVERLTERWMALRGEGRNVVRELQEVEMRTYMRDEPSLLAIVHLGDDSQVRWRVGREPANLLWMMDQLTGPATLGWLRQEQESQLAYQATHDVLTGLGNRALFSDRLAHDVELAARNGQTLAVLFVDLDEFKPINDTLGHNVGDQLLISVAEKLQQGLRVSDTLARLGGDEFVLLLPDLSYPDEAEEVAGRLLDALNKPHRISGHELHVSASIGIAVNRGGLDEPERLLQYADMAMYKAKQQGRNTYQMYTDDLDSKLSQRVTLRSELQEAIEHGHLNLHYQPLINREGEVDGLEALVRWYHPTKGFISPAKFIPIAEETGQIIPLSRWVMRQACKDAHQLVAQGLLKGRMAVNLSPLQFHRPNFLSTLRNVLNETHLAPEYLELELTEGILMRDADGAIDILHALSSMGVSTAIDDFGTGFSSLSYLRDLPIDKIKIDRSFVQDAAKSDKNAAICQGVITLALELDLRVVAEGIETGEQHDYLMSLGCEVFQGYLFAKPMPLDSLITWLTQKALMTHNV